MIASVALGFINIERSTSETRVCRRRLRDSTNVLEFPEEQ